MQKLKDTFASAEERQEYLRATFADFDRGEATLETPFLSTREEGARRLSAVEPVRYRKTRNHVGGAVSRLSPYLRHGMVSLAEARDVAVDKVPHPKDAEKFVSELAWRDYYQRVYAQAGDDLWQDQEPYKTGYEASDYKDDLDADLPAGQTGLACMDGFARELRETGYIHNHARMWVAAYVVHWRETKWQAGAEWFLHHLLDGDIASNNLSWQWVASTFSHKPYFFNRSNLEKYTDGIYCEGCSARHDCPFQGSYEALSDRLFELHRVEDR